MPATGRERAGAGVLVGAAALFVGFAVPRAAAVGFFGALTLPLVLLAADLVIAAALVTWWYPLRPAAQGLAVFGVLVHALVMLRSGPLWTRGCSGFLLLTHSWALVQLFLMTAAEDDEGYEHGEPAAGPSPVGSGGGTARIVEIPVTEVVEITAAVEPVPEELLPDEPAPDEPAPDEPAGDGPVRDEPAADEPGAAEPVPDERASAGPAPAQPEHEHEGRIR